MMLLDWFSPEQSDLLFALLGLSAFLVEREQKALSYHDEALGLTLSRAEC